jgi:fibronectin-binding autotransporter adhesin
VTLAGGLLQGFGTIGGNLANISGVVAPGGSIGTLTVGGNYTQRSAGTLSIEVSPTAASQLKVGGAASLAGTLALVFDPGVYTPTSYTLLTASSVGGAFSTVTGANPSGLAQTVAINPTNVALQLSSGSGPVVVAPTNDTIFTAVTSSAILTAQQMNGIILDRLGNRASGVADGQIAARDGSAPTATQYAQAGNAAVLGDVASALPQSLASEGAWFRGVGGFASLNGSSSAPGFVDETGGFLAGYDRPVAPNVYLGLAGGYLHSDIDEHSTSSGTESSARIAAYGGMLVGANLFTVTAGYAHDTFDTSRGFSGVGNATESHGGNEATAAGQWSLPLQIGGYGGGTATLTPKAGLQFVHLAENALTETGASGLDLAAGGHDTDSVQPYIGASLAQKFVTGGGAEITPELRVGYAYEAESNSRLLTVTTVSGANFPVVGVRPSRDQLTAGLGLAMIAGPNLSLYATYDAILPTGNTTEQTVQAGLRWKF